MFFLDLIWFSHEKIVNGIIVRDGHYNVPNGFITKQYALDLILKTIGVPLYNVICKKSLFDNISFPEGYVCEDIGTTYKLILSADKIYFIDSVRYHYEIRKGSITTTDKHKEHLIIQYYKMYKDLTNQGYRCYIQGGAALRALRYLTYNGFNSALAKESEQLIASFDNYKSLNLQTNFLLFLCMIKCFKSC